jgi:hypothetical protein
LALVTTSCYAPLISGKKGNYKDSTATVYQYNFDGTAKGKQEIEYKSARKTIVNETIFVPINALAATDSNGVDTLTDTEMRDKRFKIDDNIYIQRQKKKSYFGGSSEMLKEKTRKKSKFRDGCEIVICKRTKVYNEYDDLVFKENFNFLYHRSVRKIYDEGGKRLENRTVKFYFKPKFRNYP